MNLTNSRVRWWGWGLVPIVLLGVLSLGAGPRGRGLAPAVIQFPDNAYGPAGGSVSIPIFALPADGVFGADLRFFYDPAVLAPTGVTTTSISAGFSLTPNFSTAGRVILSLFGTTAMSGSGPIANILFTVVGSPGATSTLDLALASLNEGEIPSALDDGLFTVCAAVDTDGDAIVDCVDPDDDGDGVADELDCAPLDSSASALPLEVFPVSFAAGPSQTMEWTATGPGVRYDVSGRLLADMLSSGVSSAECIDDDVAAGSWSDPRPSPGTGDGYYYLVRGQTACGAGSYGNASSGTPRILDSDCP